jgi:hypothetical protein
MITLRLVREEKQEGMTPGLFYPQACIQYYGLVDDARRPASPRPVRSFDPLGPVRRHRLDAHCNAMEHDRAVAQIRAQRDAVEMAGEQHERRRKDAEAERVIARLRALSRRGAA